MKRTFLDWAATAPLRPEAAGAMEEFMEPGRAGLSANANANSLYREGRYAFSCMERARADVARAVNAQRPSQIIFTSGATEADNAALNGLVSAARTARRQAGSDVGSGHVIVGSIEHDAVYQCAKHLQSAGCDVTFLDPDAQGRIEPERLKAALRPDTLLVSLMLANNEVGSISDIASLSAVAHGAGALFHTDAVQALGKMVVDVQALGVDAASFSGHKIGGPKGIGALYLGRGVPFDAWMLGGGQEAGLRSGTQNVAGMVGFAAAATAACDSVALDSECKRLMGLRDRLYATLCARPEVSANVDCRAGSEGFLPNIVSVRVAGLESETLILRFDMLGFAVAGGSACSSHSLEPSRILARLGISRDEALGALRVSMGFLTTEDDVDDFVDAFEKVVDWRTEYAEGLD